MGALVSGRWTKSERTKALAAELKGAGFARSGADWVLERNDLRWISFLSVVRDPDGDIYDVMSALYRVGENQEQSGGDVICQFGVADVLGLDAQLAYGPATPSPDDPLIRDVQTTLLPSIERHDTALSALRALSDGAIRETGWPISNPASAVLSGWHAAKRLGYLDEVNRAELIVSSTAWDRRTRRFIEETAAAWGVGNQLVPGRSPSRWGSLLRRS
ncbi:hypothetical protein [uncultured Cellulomonas sp.]|uniref:hypothetical protein n=1 Tax=uncultured Cellulomonas sp. TaxID=189682 RepID=UPI00261EF7A7|nr:hypothetical protein [uncultured Cellulomonas sp.]